MAKKYELSRALSALPHYSTINPGLRPGLATYRLSAFVEVKNNKTSFSSVQVNQVCSMKSLSQLQDSTATIDSF